MKESIDKALKKARKRKMSWTREMELKEARIIINKMKKDGLLASRETYMDDILKRISKSKRAKKSPKLEV